MPAAIISARHRRLVRELQGAYQLLRAWETSLAFAADQAGDQTRPQSQEAAAVLAMVKGTRLAIQRRLHELGMGTEPMEAPPGINPRHWKLPGVMLRAGPEEESGPALLVSACRACGRALGAVFREAQAVADAATSHLIYHWLRAFEKHLWVLNPEEAARPFPLQLTGSTR